jgi:diguanylate cyclase (GGDEF)-like protein
VRTRRRPAILAYEAVTIAPLLGWLAWSVHEHPVYVQDLGALAWIIAIAVVDLLPIPTTVGFPFFLSFPLQLSVALIYPPPLAAAIAFLGSSDERELKRQIPFLQGIWNRSQIAWSVVAESVLFRRMASLDGSNSPWWGQGQESEWWQLGLAVLACALVGYAVNVILVAFYFHLRSGEPTVAILREMHVGVFGEFVVSYMGLALFAVIVATTFLERGLWTIAVFIAPLAFARQMFTRTHSLQEATVELQERQREKEYQALHDALTDLPNRVLFQQTLRDRIDALPENGSMLAVMLMDLDHFKEINDALGHHFGDLLLQQIGPRLAYVLREDDLMARLGGDEFGIVLPTVGDEATAIRIAERLLEELERPLTVDGLQLDVSGSIGIALYPTHSTDVDALMRRADLAMYAAKESGSGYEVFNPSLDRYSPSRLALIGQVRPAMETHEFVLEYQPKITLADRRVAGVEALVRWDHPARGIIVPDDFVPMIERTLLLKPFTTYVLNEALRQAHMWNRQDLPMEVAVNLSARSLLDPLLPDLVSDLLDRWSVPASRLTLELTENFLMADSGRSVGIMTRLAKMGVSWSIDDFGTGYSSLSHLKRLPIREIKVDRSFVEHMREDANDRMIVRATIDLGRNLGLRVVAEGVEDEATLDALAELGCDMAQGFHLGTPLASAGLTRYVEERGGAAALSSDAPALLRGERGLGHLHVV